MPRCYNRKGTVLDILILEGTLQSPPEAPALWGQVTLMAMTSSAPSPTLDLYFFPTPNGQKITLMLEECELP